MQLIKSHDLQELKKVTKITIDTLAGTKRETWLTITKGQDITYARKLGNAREFILAGEPMNAENDFMWVVAEANARNISMSEAANYIINTAQNWERVGSAIEGARQKAKIAINNAISAKEIYDIEQVFLAELEAIV